MIVFRGVRVDNGEMSRGVDSLDSNVQDSWVAVLTFVGLVSIGSLIGILVNIDTLIRCNIAPQGVIVEYLKGISK
jgi:hypothetical protein